MTPLSGPEKSVARFNALKSLDAKKFPQIRFTTDDIALAPQGYGLTGTVEIHGTSRAQVIDLAVEDTTDAWAISAHSGDAERLLDQALFIADGIPQGRR